MCDPGDSRVASHATSHFVNKNWCFDSESGRPRGEPGCIFQYTFFSSVSFQIITLRSYLYHNNNKMLSKKKISMTVKAAKVESNDVLIKNQFTQGSHI